MTQRTDRIIIFRTLQSPFGEEMPLSGFSPIGRESLSSSRARPLLRALGVRTKQIHRFEIGELRDGRWAIVGCTHTFTRGAIEKVIPETKDLEYSPGHISPIEALPEIEARAILARLFKGLSIDDVIATPAHGREHVVLRDEGHQVDQ